MSTLLVASSAPAFGPLFSKRLLKRLRHLRQLGFSNVGQNVGRKGFDRNRKCVQEADRAQRILIPDRWHVRAAESDVGRVEGLGAINFMDLDDMTVAQEGEAIDPASVIELPLADRGQTVEPRSVVRLPVEEGLPVFPAFEPSAADPFLRRVQASGKRWVLIGPKSGTPTLALDAPAFLRAAFFASEPPDPLAFCHRPVTVTDPRTRLAEVLGRFETDPSADVIDRDLILLWSDQKRIITGADLFGYLMRGIAREAA